MIEWKVLFSSLSLQECIDFIDNANNDYLFIDQNIHTGLYTVVDPDAR
mgnify:CR=1 FL=1